MSRILRYSRSLRIYLDVLRTCNDGFRASEVCKDETQRENSNSSTSKDL